MTRWTLDYCPDMQMEGFRTIAEKPSADACRTEAKSWQKSGNRGRYRIFAPDGTLHQYAHTPAGSSWRLKWQWAGIFAGETRETLALPSGD